ncbi:uracil phosphoribosyltransferase-domain-containing protein [Tricharina praecox]|uniref:uracil phosphoribosyltransferase-domain-containing protein n=1 Tax=Tricharina praecox TaxID=43433 RepID=UPI00222047EC|nr:uracil phosphoribosyltransferase-domain-containing protein [Tricharina praecox]KAI5843727.1 uracil phosphoribosyltransferase-domain-containing protein [Tricharina praecox]
MSLPANVTVSSHPCLLAKLSQLRSASTSPKETKALVHELSILLGSEALSKVLTTTVDGTDVSPLGVSFDVYKTNPSRIVLVPILRSGLGMVEALQTILPVPVPVHHLGLFREKTSLQPVEYYNNLPTRVTPTTGDAGPCDLAIVVDPVIATGGTAEAAIQTLKEWGVPKILVLSILGSTEGVTRAANEAEGVEIFVGAVDKELGGVGGGMIVPGVGDIGDRLFLTIGK